MALKKAICYNFYPSRTEEEAGAANSSVTGSRYQRALVEIRDVHPPPKPNPHHPWRIRKILHHYEIASGKIIVSFSDTFQHILPDWDFCIANHLAILGQKIAVVLWDYTNVETPTVYAGNEVYFQITLSGNYILCCKGLMRERNLKANDKIGLYWDSEALCFCFRVFY